MLPPPRVLEGEILDGEQPLGNVRVLGLRNVFTMDRAERFVPEGGTLADIVQGLELEDWKSALVAIDGRPVPQSWWSQVRPRAGHVVTVRAIPRGGGGGGGGSKGWIQLVAGIVLIIVGIVLIAYGGVFIAAIGASMLGAGIGLALSGAMTLIFPPPNLAKLKEGSGTDAPVFSITGSRNHANPYGAVPVVFGRHRIFPTFGALPFTEIVGNTQYLRQLFVVGYGPLELSDLRIGETPIENYQEVEIEIRQGFPSDPPLTLFTNSPLEESFRVSLARQPGPPTVEPEPVRLTNGPVDEWSVDFVFENGLNHINGDGQIVAIGTRIRIYYRKLGAVDWILASDKIYTAVTTQPLRRSVRQVVSERAIYEIKMHQTGGQIGNNTIGTVTTAAWWAVLRSVLYEEPINLAGLCRVAIRIKATDQLNGVVDQFNCIAESILPDYDATTGGWVPRTTSNPASIFRHVLQGSANARPLADNRLDLPALQAWHDECAAKGRTFSFIVEQFTTVDQLLQQVVAVGRATRGSVDGTFGVVRDVLQTVPVQHFTPRNSRDFKGAKIFREIPHAIKARFINPDANWEVDERFVYDDGFDETNATKFESLQFLGITDPDQAFKEARYHLAAAKLRPEVYEFVTDIEHLVCTRGDLIRITHDVPLFGVGSGRLTGVTIVGANVTALTVDEPMTMELGTQYDIRVRRADGVSVVMEIVTAAGPQTVLTLTTPLPAAEAPAAGDLFGFGAFAQESIEAIVTRIEMLKDLGARITCVDAAPELHLADTGPIPEHDPRITRPPELRHPPAPLIFGLASRGTLVSQAPNSSIGSLISVQWIFPSSENLDAATVQAAWRESGLADEEPWTRVAQEVQAEANAITIGPLTPGRTVDIRLRSVSRFGVPSAWVHVILIELPIPPISITYSLEPITDGYLARIDQRIGPPPPPRVTGLRLVNSISGSPNDTNFAGTEAKFAWNAISMFPGVGDPEDDLTQDTEIRDYVVEIHTTSVRRHATSVTAPAFVYAYEQNLEDHAGAPSRTLTIKVWARSQAGQLSIFPAELTVQNPAPDMSQITPILTPTIEALVVDWKAYTTTDHDLDRFDVLVSTFNPPTTKVATRSNSQREAIVPGLASGVAVFVRVLPYDAFGAGIASQVATATPLSMESIDFFTRSFTPQGIAFSFNPTTHLLSWTAGTLVWTIDGTTIQTRAISAGSATWTAGALFVYYILGETIFRTTTTASIAIGTDRAVMALYRGGADLVVNWGKVLIHGADIIANSIGANQLVVSTAVITVAAQIANAIIGNAHITDLTASKITAGNILTQILIATGKIATAASGARVEMTSGGLAVLNSAGQQVFKAQPTTPFAIIGRSLADGAATPPIELSSSGDLAQFVTDQIANLAIIRFARAASSGSRSNINNASPSEAVIATLTDFIHTVRTEDTVGTWWRVAITVTTDTAFSVSTTGTVRLRRGTTTGGVLLGSITRTLAVATKGGAAASGTAKDFFVILQIPAAANANHSFVITAQITGESGVTTSVSFVSTLLMQAKSA